MLIDVEIEDTVVIAPGNIQAMRDSNRSCCHPNYPDSSFIAKAEALVGVLGVVTHRFRPDYEMTACFNGMSFHMKDSWVTKIF